MKDSMTDKTAPDELEFLPPNPEVERLPGLDNKLLKEIGQALGGRHWQSDIARESGLSKSQITRYLTPNTDFRTPNVNFGLQLNRIMVDKIEDVTNFIGHKALPDSNKENVTKAIYLLRKAVELLRKTSPAVARVTIEETSTRTRPPGAKAKAIKYLSEAPKAKIEKLIPSKEKNKRRARILAFNAKQIAKAKDKTQKKRAK